MIDKKQYVVKIVPLVPTAPKFVDVDTINKGSAEFIALQKLKEKGVDINYYKAMVTEIK